MEGSLEEQALPPEQKRVSLILPSLVILTLGHLMGIGGCLEAGLKVQASGTGVVLAKLKRGHSRMSGRLDVRGLRRSRGRDWARRQGGCSRHRVLPKQYMVGP